MALAAQPAAASPQASSQTSSTGAEGGAPRAMETVSAGAERERRSRSFLVRVWLEPRELDGAAPLLRGSLRDLQSGDETYFTEPGEMGERLLDSFEGPELPDGASSTLLD